MIQKRTQLSVMAVAALAIVAVAAVMLLAGGNPAQATNAETRTLTPDNSGGGHLSPLATDNTPTPTPRFPGKPPCPEQAAPVVDSGYIALFDVWWNTEELELTNSSCPPTVTHVPAQKGGRSQPDTPARDDRAASNIDIEETVIHIPNSAKVALSDTNYPKADYEDLWDADDEENPDGDGDGFVWALPACPPEGSPPAKGLCLSFSAALLNDADWDGDIVYHVDHVHQVDIDKQDARYVLVYDGTSGGNQPLWNSYDARVSKMPVAPGEYERPMWFFTSRGSYEFQVHITGEPEREATKLGGQDPVTENPSVNSDVRTYILHVGAEADVGVGMTVTPESASPTDDVTITLTASNAGPETAPGTKVEVSLPEGLTYSSHVAATGTSYDSTAALWTIGDLAKGASKTLTVTATVGAGTRGETLKVKATISATETLNIKELKRDKNGVPVQDPNTGQDQVVVQTYHVPVPDKVSGNNMSMDTVTVPTIPNVEPMFQVTRSVPENSPAGTLVGDPIAVREPNSGDTLTFSLTGAGADQFTASSVSGGAQIAVANGANLDYEAKSTYELVLRVSDGKDANGNADDTVDHTIGVSINMDNVKEPYSATLRVSNASPNVGEAVTFTVTLQDPPVPEDQLSYIVVETTDGVETERDGAYGKVQPFSRIKSVAGTHTYQLRFWTWEGNTRANETETNRVTVTWSAAQ